MDDAMDEQIASENLILKHSWFALSAACNLILCRLDLSAENHVILAINCNRPTGERYAYYELKAQKHGEHWSLDKEALLNTLPVSTDAAPVQWRSQGNNFVHIEENELHLSILSTVEHLGFIVIKGVETEHLEPEFLEFTEVVVCYLGTILKNLRLISHLNQLVLGQTQEFEQALPHLIQGNFLVDDLKQAIEDSHNQHIHTEKMAHLGTITSGFAHEINNPIGLVNFSAKSAQDNLDSLRQFFYNLLDEDTPQDIIGEFDKRFDNVADPISGIQEGSSRIMALVKDLRNFSRKGEVEQIRIPIVDCLKSTLSLVRLQFKDSIEFIEDYQACPELLCWPTQLNQVFLNIMVNACQAIQSMQEKKEGSGNGKLSIVSSATNCELTIAFEDNGVGIVEDEKNQVFEPYYTTKTETGGTGLGMSISVEIIQKHNGRIEITSEPFKKTVVSIILPLDEKADSEKIPS